MGEYTQAYLRDVVKKFLDGGYDGNTWKYQQYEDIFFAGGISLPEGKVSNIKFLIIAEDDHISCYHIFPLRVPEEYRAAVCEFITRANYDLKYGNFEMDFNDGELRYKLLLTEHNFMQKDSVALANMKLLMFIGMQSWMRYGNSIVDIMFGKSDGKAVKDMVKQCEQAVE